MPNYTLVLYKPEEPKRSRFMVLKPSSIARMYHSTSTVLPSGKIWVSGSNPYNPYKDVDKFPTETRVEAFCPCIPHPSPLMDSPWDKGFCFLITKTYVSVIRKEKKQLMHSQVTQ
ncbi:Galactose oxidase [Vigna unguiculata]|uniref:Galactose oxidase n=1 Tax=Vigna unguiculata TaxID=3917 RepID=A0A4D6MAG4_VIGUN|nr:Galactose oxidase [Vigna unguiculata]